MLLIHLRRQHRKYERQTPDFQRQLKTPLKDQQNSIKPLPIGSGIFAAATLVGISIIATELLVIATPSIGLGGAFMFLVLGALLAGCMLASAMVRIFRREE
ncbi:hypothetical protein PY365_01745 [Roseiarcaceae bacterium H3SJ34-1]|uniref:hypothetical protein n=1 Tax=Terripilifer ovatus TaxID=3032367 RepID=UPI003AB945FC|nr:hypothetical protein [Roseiarcaceae bacterium H3SJ34-1]